jgi:hypothetical protein
MLYFDELIISRYKKELSIIGDYYNRTKELFRNIGREVKEFADSFYKNYPVSEDIDPADVADKAQEQGLEMYETLNGMKSYHLQMTIAMLYSIWEKQIHEFTIQELRHDPGFMRNSLPFEDIQRIFESHGIVFSNLNSWGKIRELKLLTNVIKHGEGSSADSLSRIRPDLFDFGISDNSDLLNIISINQLNDINRDGKYILLNKIKESDLFIYIKATKEFWEEMPERA